MYIYRLVANKPVLTQTELRLDFIISNFGAQFEFPREISIMPCFSEVSVPLFIFSYFQLSQCSNAVLKRMLEKEIDEQPCETSKRKEEFL